jgi:hypothetical protein
MDSPLFPLNSSGYRGELDEHIKVKMNFFFCIARRNWQDFKKSSLAGRMKAFFIATRKEEQIKSNKVVVHV